MDPNKTLEEMLALAKRLENAMDTEEYPDDLALGEDAEELAALVLALDGWLAKGGFMPGAWVNAGACRP